MLAFNLDELRKRGYDTDTFTDEDLLTAGESIFEIVKLFTNREFEIKNITLKLDGQGVSELYLPIPIISITSVTIEDYGTLGTDEYVVYNRNIPNDTDKPYIISTVGDFPKGNQNITVVGIFGWVDGNLPPKPILEVCYRLLYLMFQPFLEGSDLDVEVPMNPSEIRSETRDRWSYEKYNRESIGVLFDNFCTAILMKYSRGSDILYGGWV